MQPMREPTYFTLAALLDGPLHGYAIAKRAEDVSGGRVRLTAGTLYAALERLLEAGLVAVEGEEVVRGRARRYYRLTAAGSAALRGRGRPPDGGRARRVVAHADPRAGAGAMTAAERVYRLALRAYPPPTGASAAPRS